MTPDPAASFFDHLFRLDPKGSSCGAGWSSDVGPAGTWEAGVWTLYIGPLGTPVRLSRLDGLTHDTIAVSSWEEATVAVSKLLPDTGTPLPPWVCSPNDDGTADVLPAGRSGVVLSRLPVKLADALVMAAASWAMNRREQELRTLLARMGAPVRGHARCSTPNVQVLDRRALNGSPAHNTTDGGSFVLISGVGRFEGE